MLVLFVGTFIISSFLLAQAVNAQTQDPLATAEASSRAGEAAGMPVGNAGQAAADVLEVTSEKLVHPPLKVVLKTVLINLLSFVLNRLAYDLAVFMASGGQGQTPNFQYKSADEYFADLGMDIVGAHMDALNGVLEEIDVNFNVCAPEDPIFRMGIQLGIRSAYSRPEPDCDIRDAINNWDSFVGSIQERFQSMGENPSDYVLNEFKKMYRPGSNELSASFTIISSIQDEATTHKNVNFLENLFNQGYSPVTDTITGQVETPADIIQRKTQQELVDAKGDQTQMNWDAVMSDSDLLVGMGMSAASVFLNTLLSELLNNIYTGVFDVELVEEDVFSGNYASVGGREAAEEKYRDLLSVELISLDSFSPVTELLACPGSTSRGIFNCAMDAAFATAVTAAETGEPMTVQEALDDGILHGGWPLIPPDDYAKNQDPYCYTYGYCYANLVKLRKFRIIPVGWEMAAASPYNSKSNPVTLQEVVDSFDDCSSEGKANANHPWCHMIDPNWVLKAPETYCPAAAPGELLVSSSLDTRQSYCMDTPSCIATDDQGNCIGGQGYCTREKNVWNFRGDECPEQYASCLNFQNTDTNETASWLLNTVDFDDCTEDNAGCMWYRTNKYFDDLGTGDTSDDSYEWLATGDDFVVDDRDDDIESNITGPGSYAYDTDGDGTDDYTYEQYAYEDRIYMTGEVVECDEADAGCTELVAKDEDTFLNLVANSSFEYDENGDGEPDFWYGVDTSDYRVDDGSSLYGLDSIEMSSSTVDVYQEIKLTPNAFYTLSFFVKDPTAGSMDGSLLVEVYDEAGVEVSLTGTTILGDCVQDDPYSVITEFTDVGEDWGRYECIFTAPSDTDYVRLVSDWASGNYYLDAIQLEEGSIMSDYQEEYGSSTVDYDYYKLPPDYLGCTGSDADPDECDNYVQMCSAQDVGCNLYYPEDGDPEVPAIITELDQCPDECVGYDTYKQEATLYDESEFPLYFIPSSAASCDETSVGCDEFTNLDEVVEGGEGLEYYTYLRACSDPADTAEAATFFSWEGSDQNGYQLVSWDLIESNLSDSTSHTFASGFEEDNIGRAPCVNPIMLSEGELVCDDSGYEDEETGLTGISGIAANEECDEHDDIFSNPDCREFYDSDGNIHYREFSLTATVTEDCAPYRKTESTQDDCTNSGGYWTPGGECRYLGYDVESTECSSSANGCRSYTGGAGRNATTIFYDEVEDGALNEWNTASATISNDSVVADGHSIFMPTGGAMLDTLYVDEDIAGTTCPTDEVCTITDPVTGASCDIVGTDENDYCGTLVGGLVQGKTYILSFWAKGNGQLNAFLTDHGGWDDPHAFQTDPVELSGSWQLYTMGPLDTSDNDFTDFDDSAILQIYNTDSELFYIDNIQLKEVEDNITLIKNSWVTPASCDQSPTGADSAQYYLGCEAYTDADGEDWSLYRFTNLCSDDAIGCSAYFDTQNSSSPYAEVHNATCSAIDFNNVSLFTPDGDGTPEAGEGYCTLDPTEECATHTDCIAATFDVNARCVAYESTACEIDGESVCTIGVGDSTCKFDWDGNLPVTKPDNIWLAPETKMVPNDEIVYFIADNAFSCSSSDKGCTELGLPDFNQDKSEVESFESVYLLDQPDSYNTLLCEHQSLFCQGWSTNEDGNYYFKHPDEQTCEWKEAVTINNDDYTGWFKTGTTEPCYTDYLISGDEYGIWRNGDLTYDGWVGECGVQYDRCTEFVDVTDMEEGGREDGTPYYYLRNDAISESEVPDSQKCNGQVSQRYGCALFNDTSDSNLLYNAGASYVVSAHADQLFGDAPHSLQTPIDCENEQGGEIVTVGNTTIDVCTNRCQYEIYTGVNLPTGTYEYGDSCVVNDDCPIVTDDYQNEISGTCVDAGDTNRLTNDVNVIQKVYRDRECAEWITCINESYSWDERLGSYRGVCSGVSACNEYSAIGDTAFCVGFPENDPDPLTLEEYSARDVTWFGRDYSGYSIPELIPAEFLTEININPNMACVNDSLGWITNNAFGWPAACSVETDCDQYEGIGATYTCTQVEPDIRMGYQAGGCELENGEDCAVGVCEDSGESCLSDTDCTTGSCLIGFCEVSNLDSSCTTDSYCATNFSPYSTCVNGICTQVTTTSCSTDDQCGTDLDADGDGDIDLDYECDITSGAFVGTCINGACSVDQYGTTFNIDTSETLECRGYPEQTAPYPQEVIDEWRVITCTDEADPSTCTTTYETLVTNAENDSIPSQTRTGYDNVNVCSPGYEDCLCSYDKATYGNGSETRYYEYGSSRQDDALSGVCFSGALEGRECTSDEDCGASGSCMILDGWDSYLGWEGFCLERDSAMNRWGDANGPGVCLTWLPVDQFAGSTDIYAKNEEAGFPLDDYYYCAETAFYYDYYPTGAVFDDGVVTDIVPACAEALMGGGNNDLQCQRAEVNNGKDSACGYGDGNADGDDHNEYDSCWYNVGCPPNYYGIVGYCHPGDESNPYADVCLESNGDYFNTPADTDDDCPYFCVPEESYNLETGESCDAMLTEDVNSHSLRTVQYWIESEITEGGPYRYSCQWGDGSAQETSRFGTRVYLVGTLDDAVRRYKNCVVRGVPAGAGGFHQWGEQDLPIPAFNQSFHIEGDGEMDFCFEEIDSNCFYRAGAGNNTGEDRNEGYFHLDYTGAGPDLASYGDVQGAVIEYLGCYALVQTSTEGGENEDPENKAWTNRLWDASYALQDPEPDNWGDYGTGLLYTKDTSPTPAGQAQFLYYYSDDDDDGAYTLNEAVYEDADYKISGEDSSPLPPVTCDESPPTGVYGAFGLEVKADPGACSQGVWQYPTEAQMPGIEDVFGLELAWSYEDIDDDDEERAITSPTTDYGQYGSSDSAYEAFVLSLGQFFAKSYEVLVWDWAYSGQGDKDGGAYRPASVVNALYENLLHDISGDITEAVPYIDQFGTSENDGEPSPPHVMGVSGVCFGTLCREDSDPDDDLFTLNDNTGGSIIGEQFKHVIMKFFFGTDPNQFPIRTVKIDWGDGYTYGSESNDNYYKAHRGLVDQSGNETTTYCDTNEEWGMTAESCDPSYFTFNHDYTCGSVTYQQGLPACVIEPSPVDGRPMVLNSPCQNGDATSYGASATACIFQPRLYIKDNWGYCTGYCEGSPAGDLCYDDSQGDTGDNECNLDCPSEDGTCPAIPSGNEYPNGANPWIYYNGLVEVEPD